jgi:prepilin-type N-terminal cleavage/methylation domain-containing protein
MATSPRRTQLRRHLTGSQSARSGFTLIEMLIAVTLVLLMMVLFAEIFGLAGESMTLQQAIADGDQQVRSFTTVLRSDLQKRTMRTPVPFSPDETPDYAGVPFADRQGYLYVSLNDPDNAGDNLLQFTVRSTILDENGDETPYFGRGTGLVQRTNMGGTAVSVAAQDNVRRNPQQPEHDDGELGANSTASSTAAEICYYLRGGRLYRRQVLIRNPLVASGTNSADPKLSWDSSTPPGQPIPMPIEFLRHNVDPSNPAPVQTFNGHYLRYVSPTNPPIDSDDYWNDFDNGAVLDFFATGGAFVPDGARLVGTSLLNNATEIPTQGPVPLGVTTAPPTRPFPYTIRTSRFGFDQFTGISREFSHADPSAAGFAFLGRFTLEEMSHPTFNFPQNPSINTNVGGLGNPFSYTDYPAAIDALPAPDGVVDDFVAGDRRGQDLLMSNVHAFDVELWDDRLGRFVQPGHSLTTTGGELGDFHRGRNLHFLTGFLQVPGDPAAWNAGQSARWGYRIFDTWHRLNDPDGPGGPLPALPPPYRPMTFYPPGSPIGPYANRGIWQPATQYNVGDIVFPATNRPSDFSFYYLCTSSGISPIEEDLNGNEQLDPAEDMNMNGMLDPGEDLNGNGVLDPAEDVNMNGRLDTEPGWPTVNRAIWFGRREDTNNNGTLDPGEDFNGNGTLDGEPNWIAVRNVRPLRAIRVRVRFFHEASSRMRQVSIVHSLTDENPF